MSPCSDGSARPHLRFVPALTLSIGVTVQVTTPEGQVISGEAHPKGGNYLAASSVALTGTESDGTRHPPAPGHQHHRHSQADVLNIFSRLLRKRSRQPRSRESAWARVTGDAGSRRQEITPDRGERTCAWAQLCNVTRADTLASELGTNQQAPAGQPYSAITSSPCIRPGQRARGFANPS